MNSGLPSALILGIDQFGAKNLAEELVNKDIKVVGVGDFVGGLNDLKNFEWADSLELVEGEFNYVFDFVGEKESWKRIRGEKFTLISVNNETRSNSLRKELQNEEFDWRIVDARGVYGVKMEDSGFLPQVIKQAVINKNLELPSPKKTIRLLAIKDLTEAILRACFLSETSRECFLVLGEEVNFERLAKVLMDKAKMTRFKVMEKEIEINQGDQELAKISEKKLRWKTTVGFEEGIVETLQYFFSKTDEENRQKKKSGELVDKIKKTEEKINKRVFDVVVEEIEQVEDIAKIVVAVEPKIMVYDEKEVEEEESNFEIPSLIIKPAKKEIIEEDYIEEESEEFLGLPKTKIKKEIDSDSFEKNISTDKESKVKNRGILRFWWVGLIILLLMLFYEPVKWGWVTWRAVNKVKEIPELIKNKKYNQVEKGVDFNTKKLTEIDEKINEWGLNGLEVMRNYQTGLKILVDFLTLEKGSIELIKSADLINEAIFLEKEIVWEEELVKINKGLVETENNMGILQARLSGDYNWLPSNWRMTLQKGLKTVDEIKLQIGLGRELVKIFPEFLGLDGNKREYMLLFQNESELRPTGGFIGSFGIISFQKGKLIDFEIKDIYEADGQLKGHVEPPKEIKIHLNEANWFMRDANWNADFVKTSADIQWFLDKEVDKKVDGVIGIDLAVVRSILKATGGVYVPDFKATIDENNLYEQAEFYAETKFFPGSAQKASFLGALGQQLFEQIKSLKMDKRLVLVQSVIDLLEKNEIQIALNNKESAIIINDLGWSGKIYNGNCAVENCVADYLYVVEANFGVNKANYFLSRNIEESVEITNNLISRVVKINYENMAKNSNWPGGDYKNYLRIYLPKDINLSQISVMDGDNTSIKKIYNNSEITIKEVDGKKEIGFLMTVPVLKKRVVEIKYSSEVKLDNKKDFTYMKYIQRQPGSGETGLVSLISFGGEWQPIQVEPAASLVGGRLLFNQKLDRDIKMGVVLGK